MKKVIVITGCSSGLGKFMAEQLAREGNIVYAGIRDREKINKLRTEWKSNNLPIHTISLDITSPKNTLKNIFKKEKRINVLINNAGNTISGPAMEESIDNFKKLLEVNLFGAFKMMLEIYPMMKKQGGGKIINITSLNGLLALPNFALYSASKFALQGLSNAVKYEVQRDNIWVTALSPGAIERDRNNAKKLSHIPAREKFFFLKLLIPMLQPHDILRKINELIQMEEPPSTVIMGRDAKITLFLQKFLPQFFWERIMYFVWNK